MKNEAGEGGWAERELLVRIFTLKNCSCFSTVLASASVVPTDIFRHWSPGYLISLLPGDGGCRNLERAEKDLILAMGSKVQGREHCLSTLWMGEKEPQLFLESRGHLLWCPTMALIYKHAITTYFDCLFIAFTSACPQPVYTENCIC